jgi:CPA2 family monovalent cation:H+ antiporter-2
MHEIELIKILAFGLLIALGLGYLTHKIKLSPIVGYLVAGFIVGPYFPGYTADMSIASQLAETGVILLMFGVGLHFNLKELLAVKNIALYGALIQSAVTTIITTLILTSFGISVSAGIVVGIAMSVASTVVLLKMLEDNGILDSKQGHIAVGWLIAEDILTVLALVVLPALAKPDMSAIDFLQTVGIAFGKVIIFAFITLYLGGKIIPKILVKIAKTKSRELFTLTILAIAFTIAVTASISFGVSFALGAFLAGMVVGNTSVNTEATANILPMRDAFAVIFFLSVGMLVNPILIWDNIGLLLISFAIVIIVKPLTAFFLVLGLGYSARVALTVAISLSQIGEFSFILAQESQTLGIISNNLYIVIIGCAILTIALNPILFRVEPHLEKILMNKPKLWNLLNQKYLKKRKAAALQSPIINGDSEIDAVIIGYGPIGRSIFEELTNQKLHASVIDMNIDTISDLVARQATAVYGDATRRDVLIKAGIERAKCVFITLPILNATIETIGETLKLNPKIKIITRVRYRGSEEILKGMGAAEVFVEENAVSELIVNSLRMNNVDGMRI